MLLYGGEFKYRKNKVTIVNIKKCFPLATKVGHPTIRKNRKMKNLITAHGIASKRSSTRLRNTACVNPIRKIFL